MNVALSHLSLQHIYDSPMVLSPISSLQLRNFFDVQIKDSFNSFFYSRSYLISSKISCSQFQNFLSSAFSFSSIDFIDRIENTAFKNPQSFYESSISVNFSHCTFISCTSAKYPGVYSQGGAIQALMSSNYFLISVHFCGFKSCISNENGGAIFADNANSDIFCSSFKSNLAVQGSALFQVSNFSNSLRIVGCHFSSRGIKPSNFHLNQVTASHSIVHVSQSNCSEINDPAVSIFIFCQRSSSITMSVCILSHLFGPKLICADDSTAVNINHVNIRVSRCGAAMIFLQRCLNHPVFRNIQFIGTVGKMIYVDHQNSYVIIDCLCTRQNNSVKIGNANLPNMTYARLPKQLQFSIIPDMRECWANGGPLPPTSQTFSASHTFIPSRSFTPSATISGLIFRRANMSWFSFKRSIKIATLAIMAAPTAKDDVEFC